MKKRIEQLMLRLVNVPSETATLEENNMSQQYINIFKELDYFKQNPNHCGLYDIENDFLERKVAWAFVKGSGAKTVVLINHSDTVDTHDYGTLRPISTKPLQLVKQLKNLKLNEESTKDLESNEWFFGRGVADMKGGAAIQLALLEQYSIEKDFEGNIVYLSVPDEETLSAGMRSSVNLLTELHNKYDLQYTLLIDVETHVRNRDDQAILYGGSIGKIMPSVFVRGVRAHIGNVFQGFSPVALLSEVANRMELNQDYSDSFKGELAPPPTWMYFRDGKKGYDVSLPETAFGYTSVLTFTMSPEQVLKGLKQIVTDSFESCLNRYNKAYHQHYGQSPKNDWSCEVYSFAEIYQQAVDNGGKEFENEWHKELEKVQISLRNKEYDMTQATSLLIQFIVNTLPHKRPLAIIAFAPPYYPHVVNARMDNLSDAVVNIEQKLINLYTEKFNEEMKLQHFYTAISDMSYASLQDATEVIPYLVPNMPLWGKTYDIPLSSIAKLQIPSINLGPWGKDLHMYTERVYKKDLLERTPWLMDKAIRIALSQNI